ncbi:MAG: integrase [Ruminococcus sp.]|nr:integrase [Ruminococcus sp.]
MRNARIRELRAFIRSQPHGITEFDDTLVKHLLAKITIFPEHLLFEFKSGVNITIEK